MKDRLRAMWCDHLSIMRGKCLPNGKIGDGDTRFCRSTYGVHYDKDLLNAPGAMMKTGPAGYGVALEGRRHSRRLGTVEQDRSWRSV